MGFNDAPGFNTTPTPDKPRAQIEDRFQLKDKFRNMSPEELAEAVKWIENERVIRGVAQVARKG